MAKFTFGSIVSPILANIYLHHVIDTWFKKRFANHYQQMVRYADDAIFCFQSESMAKAFLDSLRGRLEENHLRYRTRVLWKKAAEKLRGHYAYYGVTFNSKVNFFYQASLKLLFKWLNRRSQKKSMDWPKFSRRLQHHPLPKPWSYKLAKLDQGVFSYAI